MITYSRHTLANGLTVVANRDRLSTLAGVSVLYRVGARNESPSRTGFAHLFEHLMFRGTRNVPVFDLPVQLACGENNAFTTNDYTDYHITLPVDNIETVFWLESDRMEGLDISPEGLEAEKSVVVEEFNQRYLNQPYGDQWLLLRELVYKKHPYRWPTIGLSPRHIRDARAEDVRAFYERYYTPSNAILAVSADMEPERVFALAEKWFGALPSGPAPHDDIPAEPAQRAARRREVTRDVPATQICVAFRMSPRMSRDYYLCDMITDILAGGTSARMHRNLVKRQKLFSSVNAYVSGDVDPGVLVVTGRLLPGVAADRGEAALWGELEELKSTPVGAAELRKVKNKFEASMLFGEMNVMNKALNLSYYAMLGDLDLMNEEPGIYRSIEAAELRTLSERMFTPRRSCTLVIHGKHE